MRDDGDDPVVFAFFVFFGLLLAVFFATAANAVVFVAVVSLSFIGAMTLRGVAACRLVNAAAALAATDRVVRPMIAAVVLGCRFLCFRVFEQ